MSKDTGARLQGRLTSHTWDGLHTKKEKKAVTKCEALTESLVRNYWGGEGTDVRISTEL